MEGTGKSVRLDLPCQIPWDTMAGDDRVRFCTQCNLHVHNISVMTEDEAADFVNSQTQRVCVAFLQCEDGSASFADPVAGANAGASARSLPVLPYRSASLAKRRRWLVPTALAGAVATAAGATAVLQTHVVPPAVVTRSTSGPVMLAGAIAPGGPMPLDPRAAAAQGKINWTEPGVTHSELKKDEVGAPLMKELPSIGLDVIEIEYDAYPPGFTRVAGEAFLLGRQSATGEPGDETPVIDAVLWLLPVGSARDVTSKTSMTSTLRHIGTSKKYDAYVDVNDPKLDRIIRSALAAADQK
jgi:hypothetical protein